MNRKEIFELELSYIEDDSLRELVEDCLDKAPDYFYHIGASSTGKYHPSYALGEGGLIRHTQAAVRVAHSLLQLEMYAPIAKHHDEIIAALILHDSVKKGFNESMQYTVFEHPDCAAELFRKTAVQHNFDAEVVNSICGMIRAHMGQWNTNKRSSVILRTPQNKVENFVHQCDYLASRKFIEINFDEKP